MRARVSAVIGAVCFVALLLGCRVEVKTEIAFSDLLSEGESRFIPGEILVEVAACDDFEDSRQPSDSLVEAQELIPRIFPDAEYVECYEKMFEATARFSTLIMFDREVNQEFDSQSHVNIFSGGKTFLMMVGMPESIRQSIQRADDDSYVSLDYGMTITMVNDTTEEVSFSVVAAYVGGIPSVSGSWNVAPGGAFDLRLSDVSVDQIIEQGWARVLHREPDPRHE